ncbi:hypothetical protein DFJ73DRAFT_349450 [Zopfochytrium polystomum]|nr:hypothetical protein DFJ73DRAFT_349450 [Zopfochytrium polystomum]
MERELDAPTSSEKSRGALGLLSTAAKGKYHEDESGPTSDAAPQPKRARSIGSNPETKVQPAGSSRAPVINQQRQPASLLPAKGNSRPVLSGRSDLSRTGPIGAGTARVGQTARSSQKSPMHPKTEADLAARFLKTRREALAECALAEAPRSKSFQDAPAPRSAQPRDQPRGEEPFSDDTECFSGLRLQNRRISNDQMKQYLTNRKFIRLQKVSLFKSHDGEDFGDWVTVGVLASKSLPKISSNAKKYCVMKLCDLQGNAVNMLLFGDSFERHWKETVGGVYAILNPRVMPSSEKYGIVGIELDDPDKLLKLGTSLDFARCKATTRDNKDCPFVIDRRSGEFCPTHAVGMLKRAKVKRQELATGNSLIAATDRRGNPLKKEKERRSGVYTLESGMTVAVDEEKTSIFKAGKRTELAPLSKDLLEALKHDTSRGARCLRAARGIQLDLKPASSVFPVDAQRKLGFNPATGAELILPGGGVVDPQSNNPSPTTKNPSSDSKRSATGAPPPALADGRDSNPHHEREAARQKGKRGRMSLETYKAVLRDREAKSGTDTDSDDEGVEVDEAAVFGMFLNSGKQPQKNALVKPRSRYYHCNSYGPALAQASQQPRSVSVPSRKFRRSRPTCTEFGRVIDSLAKLFFFFIWSTFIIIQLEVLNRTTYKSGGGIKGTEYKNKGDRNSKGGESRGGRGR